MVAALPTGSDSDYYQMGDFGTVGAALSELADRTQDNVTNFYKAKVQSSPGWNNAAGILWEGLDGALAFPVAIVKAILESFGNMIVTGITTIHDAFEAAAAFFGDQWEKIQENFQAIADVWTGIFARDVVTAENTAAITNLNNVLSAQRVTYAYVGDLQDMVTAPRSQLVAIGPNSSKYIDVTAGYTIALGAAMRPRIPVFLPDAPFTGGTGTGKVYYTPILVDRSGDPTNIRWIVGADTGISAIDYYEIALCAYNTTNGNIEKVWGSGNIKDGVASTDTLAEVEIDMGLTGQSVTPGQVLFIAHQQTAPGAFQNPRPFAAVPQGDVGRTSSALLDASCYSTPSYYTAGIPSSIALASLHRENRFIPWGAISVDS